MNPAMYFSMRYNLGSNSFLIFRNLVIVVSLLLLFFLAIELMSAGFGKLSQSYVNSLIQLTSNPFITLFIGLLATAILQSSSTTTTMAVALVAVESLTVEQAIPMIIGANVGTTITSTLVSLGYITKTAEFKKAVSAGVCHDLYNIIMAALILPLELKYKLLSETSRYLSEHIPGIYENKISIIGVSNLLSPITNFISTNLGSMITILISLVLLFSSVKIISNLLYNKWIGKAKENVDNVIFNRNKYCNH
jgi:sodium-dependent phosphate cotransporter